MACVLGKNWLVEARLFGLSAGYSKVGDTDKNIGTSASEAVIAYPNPTEGSVKISVANWKHSPIGAKTCKTREQ